MKTIFIMGILTLLTALPITADSTSGTKAAIVGSKSTENVDSTIRYLLDYVSQSDCTFIRNGDAHTGVEASAHFQAKYDHFKSEIKTPEDFIRMAATKSMITGKPYLVKTTNGKEVSCAEWLGKVLTDYRAR